MDWKKRTKKPSSAPNQGRVRVKEEDEAKIDKGKAITLIAFD